MANSRFIHPVGAVKALSIIAAMIAVPVWLGDQHTSKAALSTTKATTVAASAHVEPAALTPTMQTCLSENSLEARLAMSFAQIRAERHVDEDAAKAKLEAFVEVFRRKCDLRPYEVRSAVNYLIAEEEKRQEANPAPTAPAQQVPNRTDRRPWVDPAGPREIPLCVGNCR
jgi:hypothetical protein